MERHGIIPSSFLYLQQDEKILLLRRRNTGFADGQYSLIAGHVDAGESFVTAMVREAREEAGITVAAGDLELVHVMNLLSGGSERLHMIFRPRQWEGVPTNREPDKCDQMGWYSLQQMPDNLIPYIRFSIEAIGRGQIYSEWGW